MARALLKTVGGAIEARRLISAGERVAVAVSGGADSVALLLLLAELRPQLGVVVSVAHFNHKLRGEDSDKDEKFVAKLAAKYGLNFHSGRLDIGAKAKRDKANLEDTARRARYEFFESLIQSGQVDKVMVAHTLDDQAETVLAHILRGTGIAGLAGIHPRVGNVVRPLLGVRRAELRSYLRSKKQTWREDATNRDTTRMRARIRKKLMPLLEKQFQPAVVEHLAMLGELAREDEAFLDAVACERTRGCVEKDRKTARISITDLLGTEKKDFNTEDTDGTEEKKALALRGRILRRIVRDLKPRAGQLGAGHVRSMLDLAASGENGKHLRLPGGVEVRREREALAFRVAEPTKRKPLEFESEINMSRDGDSAKGEGTTVSAPEISCVFRFRVIDWPAKRGDTIEKGLVLDCDALKFPLILRNWRPGDRLRPSGHRSEHKLKRLLSKKHVSRWEREGWPVVTSGETLVWTRGFPVAAEFAASEKTRAGLVISEEKI
jgi:tRNA(Ile)-lysidine synthase